MSNSSSKTPEPFAYTEIVKDHFLNPRNFLMGAEENFDFNAKGTVGNPVCGDQMNMYLKIASRPASKPATPLKPTDSALKPAKPTNPAKETEFYIADVRWKTYGCASAIASTSALSELSKGKTLEEAEKISAKDITDFLGGLPEHKFHCSVLGHEALKDAIKNFREKSNKKSA